MSTPAFLSLLVTLSGLFALAELSGPLASALTRRGRNRRIKR